ncbi:MAG: sulfatase [Candidatus Aminicenantaceae bacterium]
MKKEELYKTKSKILTRSKVLYLLIILVLISMLHSFCARETDFTVYRFIDHFTEDNILLSPFSDMAKGLEEFKEMNPVLYDIADKYPLMDSGTGKNPLLLKKKMKIGPVDINTLMAPPNSHYKFPVRIPANSILEFTYGIRRDDELFNRGEGIRNASFTIILETREERKEIFTRSLNVTPERSLVFNYKKIDLSEYAQKDVVLYFKTRGDTKALAGWFNPVIYVPQQKTKNVLLISLDTLRADHVGCYGYPRDTSPNIDQLAEDSAVFLNTFASSPWTLPSHVSLMTALNCINHQVYHNDQKINPSILTLADVLREDDYFNGAITGGAFVKGSFGFNKGFDSYRVGGNVSSPDSAQKISTASLNWIRKHKDRNFFLFVHTYQIHTPYESPAPYNEYFLADDAEYKRIRQRKFRFYQENRYSPVTNKLRQNIIDLYDAGILYTDEVLIKALVDELKALGIYDNTMIILVSDHGEEFYDHKAWAHSHSVYNEIIKVPLIIKFFDSEHAGVKIKKYARLIDVLPTVLDVLNIEYPDQYLDGETLLNLIISKNTGDEERIFLSELTTDPIDRMIPRKIAINQGKNKLIMNDDYDPQSLAYFSFPPPEIEKFEIYDLETDPYENTNFALSNPDLTRQLVNFMGIHFVQKCEWSSIKTENEDEIREQLRALGYIK